LLSIPTACNATCQYASGWAGIVKTEGQDLHVDAEQMRDECLTDVHTDSGEEDGEERDPGEVLEEGAEEGLFAGAPAEEGERDVAEEGEDEEDGNVDAEAGHVEAFRPAAVPALWSMLVPVSVVIGLLRQEGDGLR